MQYEVYGHCPKFNETCLLHSAWTETQVDVDWENDPVHEETILWSCWREPMPWSDNAMEEF
jgi:hypothetical protein